MTLLAVLAAGTALLIPGIALTAAGPMSSDPAPATLSPPAAVVATSTADSIGRSVSAPRRAPVPGDGAPGSPPHGSPPPGSPSPGSIDVTAPPRAGLWIWPLRPVPVVVRGFSLGPSPWSPGHRGVDLSARPGDRIYAPAGGTVLFAGVLAGRPVLSIDHGGGVITSFEPVAGPLRHGESVRQGDPLGALAFVAGHCAPAACLHWGVRVSGRYIDPLILLPQHHGPAVLLPLPAPPS